MKQTAPERCPECLSALATASPRCAECGWGPRPPRAPWLLGIAVVVASLTVWWFARPSTAAGPDLPTPTGMPGDAPPTPRPTETPTLPAPERLHVVRLVADGTARLAVLLRAEAPPRTLAFLPLARLPLRGELRDTDGDVPLVVGASEAYGFVLLAGIAGPSGAEPLTPAQAVVTTGAILRAASDGRLLRVIGHGAATPHLLTLDVELPEGEILLDAEGRAAALALGQGTALPVSPAYAWIASPAAPRLLRDLQRELRQNDPVLRLEDAVAAVEATASVAATRAAIEDLELGFGAARDAAVVDAYDRALRGAHRLLAQRLARDGHAVEGFAHLRAILDRFVGDLDCLADLIPLAAAAGDLHAAADFWFELRSRELDRAHRLTSQLSESILTAGRALERQDAAGAAELLARGVDVAPGSADLRFAYADALLATGQHLAALDQARIGAQMNPKLSWRLYGMAQRAESARAGRIEVPFDPETLVLQAPCTFDGVALALMVDTGASMTTVPTALAARGTTSRRRVQIQTASGLVEGNLVRFRELTIGDLVVRNAQAVALDLPGTLAGKGLLGMNVLRRLDAQIDSARGLLVISRSGTR